MKIFANQSKNFIQKNLKPSILQPEFLFFGRNCNFFGFLSEQSTARAKLNKTARKNVNVCLQKLGWYLQLEECSMIRQSERIQIYSQSSQTSQTFV